MYMCVSPMTGLNASFGKWNVHRTLLPDSQVFVEHLNSSLLHSASVLYGSKMFFTAPNTSVSSSLPHGIYFFR